MTVSCWDPDPDRIWEAAARIGSITGYKRRPAGWAATIAAFDTPEKAAELRLRLSRWRHEDYLRKERLRPCPARVRYNEAALRQHGVVWGLATGHIRPIVQAYRQARSDCSSHGSPNWTATEVLVGLCPAVDFDRGRTMVDAMLTYVEARHRDWFWKGLQGNRTASSFLHY